MKPVFDANRPIYLQLMEHIKGQLVRRALAPGERIAPVRELAVFYGVNPNTMQKALSELERAGCLHSERTAGRCVTNDLAVIERLKTDESDTVMQRFVTQMAALGIPRGELAARLSAYLENNREDMI